MAAVSSSSSDPWDQQPPASRSSATKATVRRAAAPVPDDWDNDDDDDLADDPQANQRIWDDANTKSPMPNLIITPSTGSTAATISPPPAAFQSPMRILKRPTSTTPPTASSSSSRQGETLKDREARYQAARERIFGPGEEGRSPSEKEGSGGGTILPGSASKKGSRTGTPAPASPPAVSVVRNPRGPTESGDDGTSGDTSPRGFGQRRSGRKPQSTPNLDPVSASEP